MSFPHGPMGSGTGSMDSAFPSTFHRAHEETTRLPANGGVCFETCRPDVLHRVERSFHMSSNCRSASTDLHHEGTPGALDTGRVFEKRKEGRMGWIFL